MFATYNHSIIFSIVMSVSDEQCSNGEYTCKNKKCILLSLTCNNNDDCDDNTDEDDCLCMYSSIKIND